MKFQKSYSLAAVVFLALVSVYLAALPQLESKEATDKKPLFEIEISLNSSDSIDNLFQSLKTYADANGFELRIVRVSSTEPKYSIGLRGNGYEIHGANPFRNSDFSFGFFNAENENANATIIRNEFLKHFNRFTLKFIDK